MRMCAIVITLLLFVSCNQETKTVPPQNVNIQKDSKPKFIFAIHPFHNPILLNKVFSPLIHYLNKNITEVTFQLEASVNYAAFENKLKNREVEFALPNPYQAMIAQKYNYHVFGKMGDDQNFLGYIIVRKDSNINKISDLKGKTISYPAPTALAAAILPQDFFYKNGLKVLKETKSTYVGSQESAIMNVYLKESQAGCTRPPSWELFVINNPEKANTMEVKWKTNPLINNALIARDDVPKTLVEKVQNLLLTLHENPEGLKILKDINLSKFESANDQTYLPVKNFIENFSKEIRNPEKEY